ncbi:hypothetical protein H310_06728 [Aphanomyces invadans]|uniref:Uncharacterized protein n=1 Tax=Aphanomyces invadans TaxID=157072 RepID=A0A024U673_9STRA|nr:hypothetical protein H310_06728 [Aphanomyces invadans]ETW01113.1 hypothetical protein H310_06728 [Aphanomyces invadans]|eukprot:XP_008870111.1 hypothetical protein H310_06728 [Aphanomyces invadans]
MANHATPPTPTAQRESRRRSTPFKSVVRKKCAHCSRVFIAPDTCTDVFCTSDCCATAAYLKAIQLATAKAVCHDNHNDLTNPWTPPAHSPVEEKKSSPMEIPVKKNSRAMSTPSPSM